MSPRKGGRKSHRARGDGERRRFPRLPSEVKVILQAHRRGEVVFEATLPSRDLSIGGVFLQSEFFIKTGTRLRVVMQLQPDGTSVVAEGLVVRQERVEGRSGAVRSGFAIQFVNYLDDAKLALANHLLAPRVESFVDNYLSLGRSRRLRTERDRLLDVLVAWELERYESDRNLFTP